MTSYIFMPPHSGLMPHPCPASSPEKQKRIVRRAAGGVRSRPLTGALNARSSASAWKRTR